MKIKLLSLIVLLSLAKVHAQENVLEGAFDGLFAQDSVSAEPQVIINAQINPAISPEVMRMKGCEAPLSESDLRQQKMDQLVVRSLYEIHKDPKFRDLSPTNKYLVVLLQKLAVIEDAPAVPKSIADQLTQEELLTYQMLETNKLISHVRALISAHQSLEQGRYNIDGYLRKAVEEYKACLRQKSGCRSSGTSLWSRWFSENGFGLYDPLVNGEMKSSSGTPDSTTIRDDFSIVVPSSETHSSSLSKKMFELMNVYGGRNFSYFRYLEGNKVSPGEKRTDGAVSAPGKIVAGIILKLANQRLVALYKYENCRLLKQNAKLMSALKTAYSEIVDESKSPRAAAKAGPNIVACPNGVCPENSMQVTSGQEVYAQMSGAPIVGCSSTFHAILDANGLSQMKPSYRDSSYTVQEGRSVTRTGNDGSYVDVKCEGNTLTAKYTPPKNGTATPPAPGPGTAQPIVGCSSTFHAILDANGLSQMKSAYRDSSYTLQEGRSATRTGNDGSYVDVKCEGNTLTANYTPPKNGSVPSAPVTPTVPAAPVTEPAAGQEVACEGDVQKLLGNANKYWLFVNKDSSTRIVAYSEGPLVVESPFSPGWSATFQCKNGTLTFSSVTEGTVRCPRQEVSWSGKKGETCYGVLNETIPKQNFHSGNHLGSTLIGATRVTNASGEEVVPKYSPNIDVKKRYTCQLDGTWKETQPDEFYNPNGDAVEACNFVKQ